MAEEGNGKLGSGDGMLNNDVQVQGENPIVNEQELNSSNEVLNQEVSSRTPFTNLSQVEADRALARTLQEQAFYRELWHACASPLATVPHEGERVLYFPQGHIDPVWSMSPNRSLYLETDAEEREMAARMLAFTGINDQGSEDDVDDHGGNPQDAWEEGDPDELSYEELLALGEVVGNESRGLSADTIASLPSADYKSGNIQCGSSDLCVICRLDYEDGETLTVLSCKHSYHCECINNWLKINKVCPLCSAEVSSSRA